MQLGVFFGEYVSRQKPLMLSQEVEYAFFGRVGRIQCNCEAQILDQHSDQLVLLRGKGSFNTQKSVVVGG